ncbi:hypothetical protein Tco_1243655 [Tanacetum coccineum]
MYRPSFDSSSSQPNHTYSPLKRINLNMNIENLFDTQEYYAGQGSGGNQDYSMGHGSTLIEVDSPVEEESSKQWTTAKEVALFKAWCDVSKNSVRGNTMKTRGFWSEVIAYCEKEMGKQVRGSDIVISKQKIVVCPKIGAFCAIIDNVERRNESGPCDLIVF